MEQLRSMSIPIRNEIIVMTIQEGFRSFKDGEGRRRDKGKEDRGMDREDKGRRDKDRGREGVEE